MRGRGFILAVILMSVPAVLLVMASLLGLMRAEATLSEWRQTQLQSLYLAQAGESVALLGLTRCNFSRATHLASGASVGPAERLGLDYPGLVVAPDGWYVWEGRGLGQDGVDQSFRLQVVFPTAGEWLITVEGAHGAGHRTLRVRGRLEGVFGYALFDAGDLSEFVRGADQTVTGAVHANGNLFLRPTSSTLTLLSDAVTSAGNIVRSRDAWGRADEGGTVRISVGSSTGALATMAGGANGTAFDSQHANWPTALTRWQGVVKDTALGAATRTPLGIESIQPGGYYDQHADRRVDGNTTTAWCHSRTFYNQAEGRWVQVQEIDLAALSAAGQYPANGLLYSSVPVRLVNGNRLAPSPWSAPGPSTPGATSTRPGRRRRICSPAPRRRCRPP